MLYILLFNLKVSLYRCPRFILRQEILQNLFVLYPLFSDSLHFLLNFSPLFYAYLPYHMLLVLYLLPILGQRRVLLWDWLLVKKTPCDQRLGSMRHLLNLERILNKSVRDVCNCQRFLLVKRIFFLISYVFWAICTFNWLTLCLAVGPKFLLYHFLCWLRDCRSWSYRAFCHDLNILWCLNIAAFIGAVPRFTVWVLNYFLFWSLTRLFAQDRLSQRVVV